jgi:hypothetical protein
MCTWSFGVNMTNILNIGWDDDCPGLTATLVREEEWDCREHHNEAEAAS